MLQYLWNRLSITPSFPRMQKRRGSRSMRRIASIGTLVVMVLGHRSFASGVSEIPVQGVTGIYGLASDPDGYIWAAARQDDLIIKMRPNGDIVGAFPTFPASGPFGIVIGPRDSVWFAADRSNSIGQMDREGRMINNHQVPGAADPSTNLALLAVGWDQNIWFTQDRLNSVGVFNTTTLMFDDPIPVTSGSRPYDIIAGPKGNMWFTEYGPDRSAIGEITPDRKLIEHSFDDRNTAPFNLTIGPDGFIWYTAYGHNSVERINPYDYSTNVVGRIPTLASYSHGIAVGPDCNVYVAESDGNNIAVITPVGLITELKVTAGSFPYYVVLGPDRNIWFSEATANRLGKVFVLSATGVTIDATVGEKLRAVVASFRDDEPGMVAENYDIQIDWRDKTAVAENYDIQIDWRDKTAVSAGAVFKEGHGDWIATGEHVYTETGTYHVTVTITDMHPGGMTTTATSTINVRN